MAPPPKGPSGDYLSAHPLSIILISPIPAIEFSISTTYILYFPAFIGAKLQAPRPWKKSTLPPISLHQRSSSRRGVGFLFTQLKNVPESFFKRKIFARPPINYSYHPITHNFDGMANETEGLAIVDYFVIEDL
jgi:hypothetical protein